MSIGCVIVCYNTPKIITRAVNSIRNYVDQVIVIDNSDVNNPAYAECETLGVDVVHTNANIGHGPGLNKGIEYIKTDYVICMDSDAVLNDHKVIKEMQKALNGKDVYGAGLVITTNKTGHNAVEGIDYLHPYFCMFKRSVFNMHTPFINHGAPFIRTMNEIDGKLKVIDIEGITYKCWHEHRRTREVAGNVWLKNWDKPYD